MAYRRVLCVVGVCAGALAIAGVVLLVGGREGGVSFLLDKYDLPYRNDGVNDMNDHSTGRIMSYSEGDRDVRERKYMLSKFDRLQSILNSIVNGPAGGPVASPPTPPPPVPGPRCGERGGPACPRPPAQPVLSYTERIIRRLRELQLRVNSAAKRQYRLEDKVAAARKPRGPPGQMGPPGFPGRPGIRGPSGQTGLPGMNGKDGLPGKPSHVDGLQGTPGVQGPQGKDGFDGTPSFIPGPRGLKGRTGLPGARGARGAPGENGENGRMGLNGAIGSPGPPGKDGMPGTNGENGLSGPKGPDGMRGRTGDPGFPGPPGVPAGPSGIGPPGPFGPQGEPGPEGAPGMTGYVGKRGVVGFPGPVGVQGLNGTDGAPGLNGIAAGDVRVFGGTTEATDLMCHFPFWHAGKTYTRCTTHGTSQPWCYVDKFRKRWGYCDLDVEVMQGNAEPEDRCHFPFAYEGKTYTQCSNDGAPNGDAHHGVAWCFTDYNRTRYGVCQQPVGGGTSEPGDVCSTPCTTDYSTRPWCYSSPDMSRWGICLYKERRFDGSFVWV